MAISKTQPMRSAEIDLVDGFNQLESDVAAEVIARRDADAALGGRIDDEILARANADVALGDMIDDEILARQSADTALGGRISDEAGARAAADTALGGRIDDEILARQNADTALGGRIDDEILARQDADTALGGRISDEAGARANADTEIMNVIGSGFSSLNTVKSNVDELQGFDNRFRIGMTQAYTIAASGTQVVSVDFNTPYESTDEILVLINPIGANETFTDLRCVLDSAGYVGFSATIENSDTVNSYTVALGFIAVKVN